MVKRRGIQIYKRRGSLACVASGIFFFSCGSKSKRFKREEKAEPRTKKKTMQWGGGGGRGKGRARVWIPASLIFFSRLSFRNYLSCVFNCDDLLGRSVISSPRSSTEVIVVLLIKPTAFWRSTFALYQTVHGNDWLYTEAVDVCVCVCFFCSAMAVRIRAFQASFTVGEIFMRWTKLSELSSWKVWRLAQLSSSEWVWIVQHVLSVCFRRIKERLKIVSRTNVHPHMQRTKLIN